MAPSSPRRFDCTVVGASFGGLSCAMSLAAAGVPVRVLERKTDPGAKLHTTGILVRDALDEIDWLNEIPSGLVRRIDGVRLYAPNMRRVDLTAPGYYFLATDTPNLMRWMADRCRALGVDVRLGTTFTSARREGDEFHLAGLGATSYLVGADGPKSRVARDLGLGLNGKFLFGIEHEYEAARLGAPDRLHCFIDRKLAPGYIGWIVAGVGVVQIGLARRASALGAAKVAMAAFIDKIAPVIDVRGRAPTQIRAGYIPCGGVVSPVATRRALLVGDSAGMVSPVTAGGIHTAIKHGEAAGRAIAAFAAGQRDDPSRWFVQTYPRFRAKRALRWLFDHFQSDLAFNLLLGSTPCGRRRGSSSFTDCELRPRADVTSRGRGVQAVTDVERPDAAHCPPSPPGDAGASAPRRPERVAHGD
ncbi:MAG: NAD(P)/FAD-dependent oxidoreductase [Caulobacteraceae bacterium]